MFKLIAPEDWNLAYFALIEICEDNSFRMLRTVNPDAQDGVQGEEYGEEWKYRSRIAAARKFRWNGFWKTWADVNTRLSGGVFLYDDLCDIVVAQFLGVFEHPLVICANDDDAADAAQSLSPGCYLFYVPMSGQDAPEEESK